MGIFSRNKAKSEPKTVDAALVKRMAGQLAGQLVRAQNARNGGARSLNGWESAATTHRNANHWSGVKDESINQIMLRDREAIRARANYEVRNCSTMEGMVNTHVTDVLGANAPRLQVTSQEDPDYGNRLENEWGYWCEYADFQNEWELADMLSITFGQQWTDGESFFLKTYDRAARTDLQFRIQMIEPQRVDSPWGSDSTDKVLMGIERDLRGRRLTYYIAEDEELRGFTYQYRPVPARDVIHYFLPKYPNQQRGIPRLASALQYAQQLRDYDAAVLEAARMAAAFGVLLTPHVGEESLDDFPELDIDLELSTGSMVTTPKGYQAHQMKTEQPTTEYQEFYRENVAKLGRAAGMPMMKILLDASNHNYSSARLDEQNYRAANRVAQAFCERRLLKPLLREVAAEAGLSLGIGRLPRDAKFTWFWPSAVHVDPLKEANAAEVRMNSKTSTLTRELKAQGIDLEDFKAELAREITMCKELGLEHPSMSDKRTVNGSGEPELGSSDGTAGEDGSDNGARDLFGAMGEFGETALKELGGLN